jgi:hypothetical protein
MLKKFYNKKTNTLTLTPESLNTIDDREFENLPNTRTNKYSDTYDFIFNKTHIYNKSHHKKKFINNVHDYTFSPGFNNELDKDSLPDTIIYLKFGIRYNQKLFPGVLPKNLITLTFGQDFNQIIGEKVLPSSITHITFGDNYNQKIEPRVLPHKLYSLVFGQLFNQILLENSLPENLCELSLGYCYNHKILKGVLPKKLKTLILSDWFNSEIDFLPKSLEHLHFGRMYDKIIGPDILPRSLKILYFSGSKNNSTTINTLPETIEEIGLLGLDSDITNLPLFFKKIKIMVGVHENMEKIRKIKIPFGCIITDKYDTIINL